MKYSLFYCSGRKMISLFKPCRPFAAHICKFAAKRKLFLHTSIAFILLRGYNSRKSSLTCFREGFTVKKRLFLFFIASVFIFNLCAPANHAYSANAESISKKQEIQKISISKCSVSISKSVPYTGKKLTPKVTVKYGKKLLKSGTDFKLKYQSNKAIGKATVTITGIEKSGFYGSKTVRFNVVPQKAEQPSLEKKTQTSVTLSWKKQKEAGAYRVYSFGKEKVTYKKLAEVSKSNVKLTNLKPDTQYLFVVRAIKTVNGINYYGEFSKALKVKTKAVKYSKAGRIIIDTEGQDWRLLVVNSTREFPRSYSPSVSYVMDSGTRLDERVTPYYVKMYRAAKKDGVTLTPYSGYRSYAHQEWNYNNLTNVYMNQYGLSRASAAKKAATVILPPGTSEHNLGLSMDICNTLNSFENTKEFKWLCKNAQNYGFILRYPKNKQKITGVIYEPWHWRFVGVENAKKIKKSGLCLEQYLKKNKIAY